MNESIAYGNKHWIKTDDGKWHHFSVDKEGDTYLNGKLIPKVEVILEGHESDPVENRWSILDIR